MSSPQFSWKQNGRAKALQDVSQKHDLLVDRFVEEHLRPNVRVLNASASGVITVVRADNPLAGTCEYVIGPLPSSTLISDVVVERLSGKHCNPCDRAGHPCSAKVQPCLFQGQANVRCLVINKRLPVPYTRRELVEMALLVLLLLAVIFLIRWSFTGLHSIWHGYDIPWIGWRL